MISVLSRDFWVLVLCGMLWGCSSPDSTSAVQKIPSQVDFNFHIKPILSDRCYACHGPDEKTREAGLRLDTKEGAFAALGDEKDHFAIMARDLDKSELHHRIHSPDPELVMPPPESNLSLSEYEKRLLDKWIEQGAEWKPHWAFIPPQKTPLPRVSKKKWPKNEIDYFILGKLDELGLQPEPEAAREKLLRRLSFDLTGFAAQPGRCGCISGR